jgi:hypothetical protein
MLLLFTMFVRIEEDRRCGSRGLKMNYPLPSRRTRNMQYQSCLTSRSMVIDRLPGTCLYDMFKTCTVDDVNVLFHSLGYQIADTIAPLPSRPES